MTHRIRRLKTALPGVLLAALALVAPTTALSGCTDPQGTNQYDQLHCKLDDTPRVSAKRGVTLFAVNYVYAFDRPTTAIYIDKAKAGIAKAYDAANLILRRQHLNVQIIPINSIEKNDPVLNLITTVSGQQSEASRVSAMANIHENRERIVGVHWPQTYLTSGGSDGHLAKASSPSCAADCNWMLMAGYFDSYNLPAEETGRDLAYAVARYFNLDESSNTSNLMNRQGGGTAVTDAQREELRASVNATRPKLYAVTCDITEVFVPAGPPVN